MIDERTTRSVSSLNNAELRQTYLDLTGDGNVPDPLTNDEKEAILFAFASTGIIYVEKIGGVWKDTTTPGADADIEAVVIKLPTNELITIKPKSHH